MIKVILNNNDSFICLPENTRAKWYRNALLRRGQNSRWYDSFYQQKVSTTVKLDKFNHHCRTSRLTQSTDKKYFLFVLSDQFLGQYK